MARVLLRKAFTFENVAEVSAAMRADDLYATPVRIWTTLDTARIFVVEAGPTAAGFEFGFRRIEWIVAAPAYKRARRKHRFVFAAERPFGSLVDNDPLFVG